MRSFHSSLLSAFFVGITAASSPGAEPDVSGLAGDVVSPVDPNTEADHTFDTYVLSAIRHVGYSQPWNNDVRALLLNRYKDIRGGEKYQRSSEESEAIRKINQLLSMRHLVRSLDEAQRQDAGGRAFWNSFVAIHKTLQGVADGTRQRIRDIVGTEVEWFLSQLPQVSSVYDALVPTGDAVSYVDGRQSQVEFMRERFDRVSIVDILRRIQADQDPTSHGAWMHLRGRLQLYIDAHGQLGLHRPTPENPLILLSSTQFARLIRDGYAPSERMRLTEYARFVEDPAGWMTANQGSIMDPKVAGIRIWKSEDDIIWTYIDGIIGVWADRGIGLATGSLTNRIKDVISSSKPIQSFDDFLEKEVGDARVKMGLRGSYAALVHAVSLRHFSELMDEKTEITGSVRDERGEFQKRAQIFVVYADETNKIILGNAETDDSGRYHMELSMGDILTQFRNRTLAGGRKIFVQFGASARSREAKWQDLFVGEKMELNIGETISEPMFDPIVGKWVKAVDKTGGGWRPHGPPGYQEGFGVEMEIKKIESSEADPGWRPKKRSAACYAGIAVKLGPGEQERNWYPKGRVIRGYILSQTRGRPNEIYFSGYAWNEKQQEYLPLQNVTLLQKDGQSVMISGYKRDVIWLKVE